MNSPQTLASTLLAFGLLTGSGLSAQTLTLPPGPVDPGSQVQGTVFNDTGGFIAFAVGCGLRILQPTGELVSPHILFGQACDALLGIDPGGSAMVSFAAPNDPGTYVVLFIGGNRAAARLDVSAPTPGAPGLAFYPTGVGNPQDAHEANFANPAATPWEFANTSGGLHTFGAGELVELFVPGGSAVLASVSLAGLSVPDGKVVQVDLPLAGLTPGPYDVRATFLDPSSGVFEQPRSGVRVQGTRVNLHLPDGSDLLPGQSIDIVISGENFAVAPAPQPMYFLAVGLQPGSTPLSDGTLVPLVADTLVNASLNNALFGTFTNNVGSIPNFQPGPAFFGFLGQASGISLAHPNLAVVVGLKVRMAAAALQPSSGMNGATQAEEIAYF